MEGQYVFLMYWVKKVPRIKASKTPVRGKKLKNVFFFIFTVRYSLMKFRKSTIMRIWRITWVSIKILSEIFNPIEEKKSVLYLTYTK